MDNMINLSAVRTAKPGTPDARKVKRKHTHRART
jgi:hypothetical protein